MIASWALAVAWVFAAYGVWAGMAVYPLGVANGCGDAIQTRSSAARVALAALAAALLIGGAILVSLGTRWPARRAARHTLWLSFGLTVILLVPFANFAAFICVPYALGLSIRAGTHRPFISRWLAVAALCVLAAPVVSFWIDASECF